MGSIFWRRVGVLKDLRACRFDANGIRNGHLIEKRPHSFQQGGSKGVFVFCRKRRDKTDLHISATLSLPVDIRQPWLRTKLQ